MRKVEECLLKCQSTDEIRLRSEKFIVNYRSLLVNENHKTIILFYEEGFASRGSDWLRNGRPRDRSSSSGRVKDFHFSTSFGTENNGCGSIGNAWHELSNDLFLCCYSISNIYFGPNFFLNSFLVLF
jgi:hypothetical protein